MKKTILKTALLLVTLFIFNSGCSSDEGAGLDTFIGNFKNNYKDLDNPNTFFSFDNVTGTDAEGSFTGEDRDDNTGTIRKFSGIYKNSYLEFTYSNGPRATKKYTGNFDKTTTNPYKIIVKNGSDVIHLQSL